MQLKAINYDGTVLHGEAVSVGIIMAFKLSIKKGYCSETDLQRVTKHFNEVGCQLRLNF